MATNPVRGSTPSRISNSNPSSPRSVYLNCLRAVKQIKTFLCRSSCFSFPRLSWAGNEILQIFCGRARVRYLFGGVGGLLLDVCYPIWMGRERSDRARQQTCSTASCHTLPQFGANTKDDIQGDRFPRLAISFALRSETLNHWKAARFYGDTQSSLFTQNQLMKEPNLLACA